MIRLFSAALVGWAMIAASAEAEKPPDTWDGLHLVSSMNFDAAYLAPGADFRSYTKVMLDPTEAAFRKDWQRRHNEQVVDLDRRITDEEARNILEAAQTGLHKIFLDAYAAAGVRVVTEPGPDVLRVRTAIINLDVTAPDQKTMRPGTTASAEAGAATLVIEVRDSMSGAVLGRGVDGRRIGDVGVMVRRTSVTNKADFDLAFRSWARASVDALQRLRALPVINADGKPVSAPGQG
ncbi:MAG TPA: DUF3313 family protein [Hyphomonadaceae bacterium]|nr:DUF3313 family protein [Hyphomonadaceae bacterium]